MLLSLYAFVLQRPTWLVVVPLLQRPCGQRWYCYSAPYSFLALPVFQLDFKMASSGGDGEHEWTAAVRPLLSASYTAFETKELPQLIGSIINRYPT